MQNNSTHFPDSEPHIIYGPCPKPFGPFEVLIRILFGKKGR